MNGCCNGLKLFFSVCGDFFFGGGGGLGIFIIFYFFPRESVIQSQFGGPVDVAGFGKGSFFL